MKKTVSVVLLLLCLLLSLAPAGPAFSEAVTTLPAIWENAPFTEDAELGTGAKTFTVAIAAEDVSVILTVHTDLETVGEALQALDLLDGEEGPYGLYVKAVNGMTADYDIDRTYWAFYIDGEFAMTGVDTTPVTEGAEYQLVRTR